MQGEKVVTGCHDSAPSLLFRSQSQWLHGVDAEWFDDCVEFRGRRHVRNAPLTQRST